jgi:hypothetical protein
MTSNASRTDLYRAFIGKRRTEYYLKRFQSFDEQGGGFYPSWNWAALFSFPIFFIAPLWALYRGMHGLFWSCFFGIPLIQAAALGLLPGKLGLAAYAVVLPVSWIVFAMYANALYYKHAQRRIRKAQAKRKTHDDVLSYLESSGSTRVRVPVTLVLVFAAFIGLSWMFVEAKKDYITRARVSEAAYYSSAARTAVEVAHKGGIPLGRLLSQKTLGSASPASYSSNYVRSISVDKNGVITVQLTEHPRLRDARNGTVTWVPTVEGDRLVWGHPNCSFHLKWCPKR